MALSRRTFLALASTSGAASLAGLPLLAPRPLHGAPRQAAPGTFTPIRRGVGHFSLRGGTVGYLVNPDGIVVVDSQFPDSADALLAGLRERAEGRPIDLLLNTHHHGDHTGGNPVLREATRQVVAHAMAAEHLARPPAGEPASAAHLPDVTFEEGWSQEVGDERVTARHRGRAHTSGDAVITFEAAGVAHMGDLLFHRRHPVVDRAAGATLRGWIQVLEGTVEDHPRDTVYIFGHAGPGFPVTGSFTDLLRFRDYLDAVLAFVDGERRRGRTREEVLSVSGPLPGFEDFGPFGQPGPREVRSCAWDELAEGS